MSDPVNNQFFTVAYNAENRKIYIFSCNKCHLQVVFQFLILKQKNEYEFHMLMQLLIRLFFCYWKSSIFFSKFIKQLDLIVVVTKSYVTYLSHFTIYVLFLQGHFVMSYSKVKKTLHIPNKN